MTPRKSKRSRGNLRAQFPALPYSLSGIIALTVKILVADDDEEILRLLEIGLRPAGIQVCMAHDAWKAFELAKKELPDAILLDISMPKGSGLDVLRLLKASPGTEHIPVIVISGSADPEMPAKAKALGAADYVAKPFDILRIQAVLAAHLGS